jgi:alpha-mannosidase
MTYEQAHIMSAWILGNEFADRNLIDQPEINIIASGGVFAKLEIVHRLNKSTFSQYITLYADFDRIDFDIAIDWHELGSYKTGVPTLKVGITSDICNAEYVYETPFGNVTRMRHNTEFPGNRYVAIKGADRSLALFNNCKFGFMAQGSSLFMTLVRGSYSPGGVPDEGLITAKYSILPSYGAFNEAKLTKDAASFNQPPIAQFCDVRADERSVIISENDNIIITCVKPANENDAIVVRLMEGCGKDTHVTLKVPESVKQAYLSGVDEQAYTPLCVSDGKVHLDILGREIKTVLITMR